MVRRKGLTGFNQLTYEQQSQLDERIQGKIKKINNGTTEHVCDEYRDRLIGILSKVQVRLWYPTRGYVQQG